MARLSKRNSIDASAKLFENFTGHNPNDHYVIEIDELPHTAAVIGRLHGVIYDTVRDGVEERYIHRFKDRNAPILAVSDDGRQLLIVGGNYIFTEKGIEDNG